MKKETAYRIKVTQYGRRLAQSRKENPEMNLEPSESFLLEDLSTRYEKTLIKRMTSKIDIDMRNLLQYGIGEEMETLIAMLDVLNARHKVLYTK